MEPSKEETAEHIFLEKFGYLNILKKSSILQININKRTISIKEFTTWLNRIVFSVSWNSNKDEVEKIKHLFFILLKNSIRIQENMQLSKILSYIFSEAFDLFINALKEKKNVPLSEFQKRILKTLDLDKIAALLDLEKSEVSKILDITNYKKVIKKIKKKNLNH